MADWALINAIKDVAAAIDRQTVEMNKAMKIVTDLKKENQDG